MRVSLVHNPASGRNRRQPFDAGRLATAVPGLAVHLVGPDLGGTVLARRVLQEAPDLLLVSGGDGTLQQLLTAMLAVSSDGVPWPAIGVLPHGTANMAAGDLGLVRRPLRPEELAGLLNRLGRDEVSLRSVERHLLAIAAGDGPAVAGLFFGAGAVCDAIDYWADRFHRRGLAGSVSQALTFLSLLGHVAVAGPERAGLQCFRGELRGDGQPPVAGEFLLALVTTLDKLLLNTTPFWGQNGAPLRVTAVERNAPHMFLNAWRVVTGRGADRLPAKYRSFGAQQLVLRGPDRYVVDGEFYAVPAGAEIVVRAGRRVRFVRLAG